MILEHNLYMIGSCETWLKLNVFLPLNEASPNDYTNSQAARATKQGRGVALIFKYNFKLNSKQDNKFSSFEALVLKTVPISYKLPGPGKRIPPSSIDHLGLTPNF